MDCDRDHKCYGVPRKPLPLPLKTQIFVRLNPQKYFLNLALNVFFLFKCMKSQLSGYTNKISLSAKEEKLPELSQNSTRYNNRHVLVTWEWYLAKCTN